MCSSRQSTTPSKRERRSDFRSLPRPYRSLAGDRYFFDGKAGYAWSPAHYDELGNTTLEFETMIIWTYVGLGIQMMLASFDDNLQKAHYLTNACIYGLFSLHGAAMLFSALADYDREHASGVPREEPSTRADRGDGVRNLHRPYAIDAGSLRSRAGTDTSCPTATSRSSSRSLWCSSSRNAPTTPRGRRRSPPPRLPHYRVLPLV